MADPFIVSPSAGRAERVAVYQLLPDIPLCVPESELDEYQQYNPGKEFIAHPDSVVGISPKRQWLYEKYGDLFMLDDDVVRMRDQTVLPGEEAIVSDPIVVESLIRRLFDQAEQMGAYLVGFNNFAHPAALRPQIPFGLTGFVAGRALGVRAGSKLFFPQGSGVFTDDLFISGLNAYHHRFCLRDDRYVIQTTGIWKNTGGAQKHRTWARMLKNNELMKEAFGDVVTKKVGSAMAPVQHDGQLTLRVPW